jgi:hypothetical protein
MVCPSPISKVRSRALSRVTFLMRRRLSGYCARYGVMILIPEMNCCSRNRSRSGSPWPWFGFGARAFGVPGLSRNSRAKSSSLPDLYMTPVEMSMLINIRSIAGRTDWKYPRHKTRPAPMGLVSWSVKNEFLFDGYLRLGSIRTTIFNA